MSEYDVLVHGSNFMLRLDNKIIRAGFFTTIRISVIDINNIEIEALSELRKMVFKAGESFVWKEPIKAHVCVAGYYEISICDEKPKGGFSFYQISRLKSYMATAKFLLLRFLARQGFANSFFVPQPFVPLKSNNEPYL